MTIWIPGMIKKKRIFWHSDTLILPFEAVCDLFCILADFQDSGGST